MVKKATLLQYLRDFSLSTIFLLFFFSLFNSKNPEAVITFENNLSVVGAQYAASVKFTSSGANPLTVDFSEANIWIVRSGLDKALSPSGGISGRIYKLIFYPSSGTPSAIWDSSFRFPGGTEPTQTQTAGRIDIYTMLYNGVDATYDVIGMALDLTIA